MLYKQSIFLNGCKYETETSNKSIDALKNLAALDCFAISKSNDDLNVFNNPRLKKWINYDNFIIFGIGGSSLCGQCIYAISKNTNKSIKFVSNLDPTSLNKLFNEINVEKTGFLCISKSGETLETICQLFIALDFSKSEKEIKDKFVIITEDKQSSLKEIANQFDFLCLDHPKTIGGRFSVFSIVGMLPALLCGIDPLKIRLGGSEVLKNSLYKIESGASFIAENLRRDLTQHVSFIYSDKLQVFGAWIAQLYAESTGKSEMGVTPITAIGSVDQHSQLQLYLDGIKNKCFTFFFENQKDKLRISNCIPSSLEYLKNQTVTSIFKAQYEATARSILERGCNIRKIEIPQITPEILGALFMHFMMEVVYVCKLINVNPFDQPAVERGKMLTKYLLSGRQC